jgi:hypothetical protein
VARIAANCLHDNPGLDVNVLLACVAKRLGFTHIVLHPDLEENYDLYLAVEADIEGLTLDEYKKQKEEEDLRRAMEDNEFDIDMTVLEILEKAFESLAKYLADLVKGG